MIVKNCDNDKNYKITLYKFSQALLKHNDINIGSKNMYYRI